MLLDLLQYTTEYMLASIDVFSGTIKPKLDFV